MAQKPIEIETAKKELIRINEILKKPHLLIGGLAVQRYVTTRDSKDIDLVCDHNTSRELLKKLYPSDLWEVDEINDDEFRPSYVIKHRYEDYGEIIFGPKIKEREPYKYLDWEFLVKNGNPIVIAKKLYPNIIIPSCSHLAFSKLISFLSRNPDLINKRRQDLEDLTDLSNQKLFSIIEFTSISQRTRAHNCVSEFLASLSDEEKEIFDRSAFGALKRQFGFSYSPVHNLSFSDQFKTAPSQAKILKEKTKINIYKLFYYRLENKKTIKQLREETNISLQKLRRMEQWKESKNIYKEDVFRDCTKGEIILLERALNCPNCLEVGKKDDFAYLYMDYYLKHKNINYNSARSINSSQLVIHKIIVFDFDGTLTHRIEDLTTWERIWVRLGYNINDCSEYFEKFMQEKITHKQWCDITRDKFIEKGLTQKIFQDISNEVKLVEGIRETFQLLREKGCKIYIISGSIKQLITRVLGDLIEFIDDIKANNFIFGKDGTLREIIGTDYDFEGKSKFLSQIMEENGLSPQEVLFIGNSINDTYASHSGADTLCVNPRLTDPTNLLQWHNCIRKMNNLTEILEYVKYDKD